LSANSCHHELKNQKDSFTQMVDVINILSKELIPYKQEYKKTYLCIIKGIDHNFGYQYVVSINNLEH
jgi:hypothetical protein